MTLRATSFVYAAAVKPAQVIDTVSLDYAGRHRRRLALTAEGGLTFLLDLERAAALHDGDALRLEDGRLVRVTAAPEPLLEIRSADPLRLMRIVWHIGNRHLPAEIAEDAIYVALDPVIEQMVRGLGGMTARVQRPFAPERGAYAGHAHTPADHEDLR